MSAAAREDQELRCYRKLYGDPAVVPHYRFRLSLSAGLHNPNLYPWVRENLRPRPLVVVSRDLKERYEELLKNLSVP